MKEMEHKLGALDDVAIEPIAPEHINSFHRGLDLVARERQYLDISDAGPLAHFRDYIKKQISNGDPLFVAVAQGEVVGWCDIERHRFAANVHSGTLNIALVPRFRDRGLGFRLISATLEQARRLGFVRIQLFVHADNPRAIALYRKVGFVEEGVLRDAAFMDGNFATACSWLRSIARMRCRKLKFDQPLAGALVDRRPKPRRRESKD
jgi:RimJ/RimL family protein N-acetyltransferase